MIVDTEHRPRVSQEQVAGVVTALANAQRQVDFG